MRFREMSLTFRIAETAEENPDLERHRRYKYPAMKKTLGNVSHIRLLPMLWPRPRPTRPSLALVRALDPASQRLRPALARAPSSPASSPASGPRLRPASPAARPRPRPRQCCGLC